ncbi:MAG: carboxypeptidase-like regulatory domain-containing protein, partial [Thermoproteota archaeon]
LTVNITGLGIYYDFDSRNNFGKRSFLARYAKIEVSGTPGVSVSLDGESQVIPEEGTATFYSTAGVKKIKAENIYTPVEGLRYVFIQWRNSSSIFKNPELTINVKGDSSFILEYRKEYFVNLSFMDRNNYPLKPSFYTCVFPNGTFYNGTLNSLWLTSGDLRIMSVGYAGLNVLEETKVYDIHEPKEISISCNVLSGTIRVVDPFSTPISGAEISAVFLNNTKKTYVADSNGMLSMKKVAGGRVKLTVSHMGYSTTVDIDFSKENDVTIRIPISLNIVLIIVAVVSIVSLTIVFKLFSNKIFRKKQGRKPAKEEYEFEEI